MEATIKQMKRETEYMEKIANGEEKIKAMFLCDGEIESHGNGCYKKGGNCHHTSDIRHALNFSARPNSNVYWEGGPPGLALQKGKNAEHLNKEMPCKDLEILP